MPSPACATKRINGAKGKWNYPQPAQSRCKCLKILFHCRPDAHDLGQPRRPVARLEARADRTDVDRILRGVEHEAGERGEAGHSVRFGQALQSRRTTDPYGLAERCLGVIREARQLGAAAGQPVLAAMPAGLAHRL